MENPLGIGGTRLHEWANPLAAWRKLDRQSAGNWRDWPFGSPGLKLIWKGG